MKQSGSRKEISLSQKGKIWYNQRYWAEAYLIRDNASDTIDVIYPKFVGEGIDYSFSISEIVWNSDNTSGIMYGVYTKLLDDGSQEGALNKWYAISFKGLSENSLSISQAMHPDGNWTDTLEEAKKRFTEKNGAFNMYSVVQPKKPY